MHLDRREAAHSPDFEAIRADVRREYDFQAQIKAEQETFDTLRRQYQVRITAKGVPREAKTALASK